MKTNKIITLLFFSIVLLTSAYSDVGQQRSEPYLGDARAYMCDGGWFATGGDGCKTVGVNSCGIDNFALVTDCMDFNDDASSIRYYDSNGGGCSEDGNCYGNPNVCNLYTMNLCRDAYYGRCDHGMWCYANNWISGSTDGGGWGYTENSDDKHPGGLSSLYWQRRGINENVDACAVFGGGSWVVSPADGVSSCCKPTDGPRYYGGGTGICYNKNRYVCKDSSNPVGQRRTIGSDTYICSVDGTWFKITGVPNNDKIACAQFVTGNSGAAALEATNYFLGPSDNYATGKNRCCGDDGVLNPGFEIPGLTRSWDTSQGYFDQSTSFAHSGTYSFRSTYATGLVSRAAVSFPVPVIAGNNYIVSGWILRRNLANAKFQAVEGVATVKCNAQSLTVGQWEHVMCKFTATTASVKIKAVVSGTTGPPTFSDAYVYFDDIQLIGAGLDAGTTESPSTVSYPAPSGNWTCSYNANSWNWKSATTETFKITYSTDATDIISNRATWYACNPESLFSAVPALKFETVKLPPYRRPTPIEAGVLYGGFAAPSAFLTTSTTSTSELVVDSDVLFSGITNAPPPPPTSTTTSIPFGSSTLNFTVTPRELGYPAENRLSLRVTGLPSTTPDTNDWLITNISGYKILVANGNDLIQTKHNRRSEVSGTISSLNITLNISSGSYLVPGPHSLNITLATSCTPPDSAATCTKNKSFLIPAFNISIDIDIPAAPQEVNTTRFICSKEGGKGLTEVGRIAECCGPNYYYCYNSNIVARTSGGPTGLLKDFYRSTGKNGVLRVGIAPDLFDTNAELGNTVNADLTKNTGELPINNWGPYEYLEFDIIMFGTNKLKISMSSNPILGFAKDDTQKVFEDDIIKYSTSGKTLEKWHHIKIPIAGQLGIKPVRRIRFFINQPDLVATSTNTYTLNDINGNLIGNDFRLVYALDRIFLSSASTKYCATDTGKFKSPTGVVLASNIGQWITDLDDDVTGDACNNVASFGWTGTQCCGDDQGTFNSDYPNGIETYNDNLAGCWNGMVVKNNTLTTAKIRT